MYALKNHCHSLFVQLLSGPRCKLLGQINWGPMVYKSVLKLQRASTLESIEACRLFARWCVSEDWDIEKNAQSPAWMEVLSSYVTRSTISDSESHTENILISARLMAADCTVMQHPWGESDGCSICDSGGHANSQMFRDSLKIARPNMWRHGW